MWTAQEFANVLERHPLESRMTLWTKTHRMVRYIRVRRFFDHNGKTVIAVLTEIWRGTYKVELFVRTPAGAKVAEFLEAKKSPEFLETLLKSPILNSVDIALPDDVKDFISTPSKTCLTTW